MKKSLESITLTAAGFVSGSLRFGFGRHAHSNEYEVHLFSEGSGIFFNGDRSMRFSAPGLVFSEPTMSHGVPCIAAEGPLSWYFIRFIGAKADEEPLRSVTKNLPVKTALALDQKQLMLFHDIVDCCNARDPHLQQSAKYLFLAQLFQLGRSDRGTREKPEKNVYVDALIALMQTRLHREMDLTEAARRLGIDRSYLIRLFKKSIGVSPLKYFNQLKVNQACHLMITTNDPVYRVAERLNFCDEFYFSRLFKAYTGVAPTDYRQRHR